MARQLWNCERGTPNQQAGDRIGAGLQEPFTLWESVGGAHHRNGLASEYLLDRWRQYLGHISLQP
jgi:hypothetical protein